MANCLKF